MIGIVLVSHSKKITDGLKELIEQMAGDGSNLAVKSNGGTDEGELGSNPMELLSTLEAMTDCEEIYVFAGVGSAKMAVETALDMLDDAKHVHDFSDYPLVESAFTAGITASTGASHEQIKAELQQFN